MEQPTIPPTNEQLDAIIRAALAEDIGDGDVTTLNTIPADPRLAGDFLVKEAGVIAGLRVAQRVFEALDPSVEFRALAHDGDRVEPASVVAVVSGPGSGNPVGRARRAELLAAHVGHRDGHAALCGCRRWHARGHPGHAQDRPWPAPARQVGRAAGRRAEPPLRTVRHGADQGQPHRRGRLNHRGGAAGAGGRFAGPSPSRSR